MTGMSGVTVRTGMSEMPLEGLWLECLEGLWKVLEDTRMDF